MKRGFFFLCVPIAVAILVAGAYGIGGRSTQAAGRWVTAWTTSHALLGPTTVTNTTVRMIARVGIGGDAVRIRLDNTFGTTPLVVGRAYVGQRTMGAALAVRSNRPVTFKSAPNVTIPPGETVTSDPVAMSVMGQQDLAVSLHLPESNVRPSQHTGALVTSYLAPAGSGDVTADESRSPFTETTTALFWLKSIDVQSSASRGAIVAFGDSITDGSCTTLDGHDRWEDWVALRLALADANKGAYKAVLNEGIGGNTVMREQLQPPPDSPPGIDRLDRDVLSHHGVTHVVLFMGTNDIRRGASAAQVIGGMQDIIKRVKARGLKTIGVTIIPRHNRPPAQGGNTGWNPDKTRIRNEVNRWIRREAAFDAILDFDQIVRDPSDPDLIFPAFDCDGIHPSTRGYFEMGKSVRLDLFRK